MRVRGFFGFGICVRKTTAGYCDFSGMLYLWRVEIDFAVWHWRVPLFIVSEKP